MLYKKTQKEDGSLLCLYGISFCLIGGHWEILFT